MDFKLAERPALLRLQLLLDQDHEVRHIGPLQPREHAARLRFIELHPFPHQRLDRRVAELPQIVARRQRLPLENLARHPRLIERRGQVRLPVARLLLVVELQIHPLAEKLQRRLRIGVVTQQRRAILDHPPLRRTRIPFRPLLHNRRQLGLLLGVLKMERREKVKVLASRNELPQDRLPIRRERKFFDEADFVVAPHQRSEGKHGGEREEETVFHKRGCAEWKETAPTVAASAAHKQQRTGGNGRSSGLQG